jgi:hypothetical protein
MVRGFAILDATPNRTDGNLVAALTHADLGSGSSGGVYHMHDVVNGVDLADGPIEFALDMCLGSEMWSSDWGDYNLILILDTNGNNSAGTNLLPDAGEASARTVITLGSTGESPCLPTPLDCVDGASCVRF